MTDEQTPDPLMAQVLEAIELGQRGDAAAAADRFTALWESVGADGDAFHRVVVAHYAADVQSEAAQSLIWNERALAAADEVTDEAAQRHHPELRVAAFYPSLHLNLARDHLTLGDEATARVHVEAAQSRVHLLADDGYGSLVRSGLARISDELGGTFTPAPTPASTCSAHAHHAGHHHA